MTSDALDTKALLDCQRGKDFIQSHIGPLVFKIFPYEVFRFFHLSLLQIHAGSVVSAE